MVCVQAHFPGLTVWHTSISRSRNLPVWHTRLNVARCTLPDCLLGEAVLLGPVRGLAFFIISGWLHDRQLLRC
jgi:hypothetical protein